MIMTLFTDERPKQPASWYIRNIEAFDAFHGEKLIIYCEDLIQYTEQTVMELAAFLDLEQIETELFIKDLDVHFQKSVEAYTQGGHRSETSSTKDLKFHARTKLSPGQEKEFDDYCFSRYPDLVNRYLDENGDPPALLGRHHQFDSNRSPIVTPKREPTSNTLRRNHETSKKFKPHAMGV